VEGLGAMIWKLGGVASEVAVTFPAWRRRASRCVGGRQQSHHANRDEQGE